LPAGYRIYDGNYNSEGYSAQFWSSSEYNGSYANFMGLGYNYEKANLFDNIKDNFYSVRCLKD
jgi:uncharacterized protein (TIGR02145 family)